MLASWAGCSVTRDCSHRGFAKYGRALLTSQILEEIGPAFERFAGIDEH